MKPQNTTVVSSIVASDLDAVIAAHPETFDAVIFRALNDSMETVAPTNDVVGTLENTQRRIEYEQPELVSVLEPTLEIAYQMLTNGDGYSLQNDGVHKLLISGKVPIQSVIAYPVAQHGGTFALRIMYVLAADALGRKAPAGYVYSLMPYLGGSEQVIQNAPTFSAIIDYVASMLE